jgi:predicted transcriptional regulator of viral defense system
VNAWRLKSPGWPGAQLDLGLQHSPRESPCWALDGSGGEGGIRTPGTSFSSYNGLARSEVPEPVVRNKGFSSACLSHFRVDNSVFGNSCSQNCSQNIFYFSKYVNLSSAYDLWNNYLLQTSITVTGVFRGSALSKTRLSIKRLVALVDRRAAARARDLYPFGVHPRDLSKAAAQGLIVKIGRGLYCRKAFPTDFEHQIVLACLRVPDAIVCLQSALAWHGILPCDSDQIWMAIDRRAKKPIVDGLKLRFVRFSSHAFTQGVVNTKIEGVPVRVYSAAKTVADCLKYRRKIGIRFATRILQESIAGKKCSEQRLRHFAKICRVYKLIHAAYSEADPAVRGKQRRLTAGTNNSGESEVFT